MKFKPLVIAATIAMAFSGTAMAAPQTQDAENYTVAYDDSTFGGLSGWWWGGSGRGFSFNIPGSVSVDATQGSATFNLPSFTITANSGYNMSGPLDLTLGSFAVATMGTAGASFSGWLNVDGGTPFLISTPSPTYSTTTTPGGYTVGSLSLENSTSLGSFHSLVFSGGQLTLTTSTNMFGAVFATGGNTPSQFQVGLNVNVTPVPEPETYAMLLAGLGLMGAIARRRKQQG